MPQTYDYWDDSPGGPYQAPQGQQPSAPQQAPQQAAQAGGQQTPPPPQDPRRPGAQQTPPPQPAVRSLFPAQFVTQLMA